MIENYERPSRDEMLMRVAAVISLRGTCKRAFVGAVIAIQGRIISTGYVGAPAGLPHCLDVGDEVNAEGGCIRTIHAEANAIAWAARNGTSTENAQLYSTHEPCYRCAQLIINAGINRVVYEKPYRLHDGSELLEVAGVEVVQISASEPVDPDSDDSYRQVRCQHQCNCGQFCVANVHPSTEHHFNGTHSWNNEGVPIGHVENHQYVKPVH